MPNPSVLTLEIVSSTPLSSTPSKPVNRKLTNHSIQKGNATFSTLLNNTAIGPTYIDNMLLVPGNNNYSIRANITQLPVIAAVTQEPYCNNGTLPLDFLGVSVINHGQDLGYFETGFKLNKQTVEVPVGPDLKAIGFNISCVAPLSG